MAQVKCPGCDRSVNLTAENEAKKVKCTCGQVFVMPTRPRNPQSAPQAAPIKFNCPSCATLLQVASSYSGQPSACPCGAQFIVPANSVAPQSQMQPQAAAQNFVPEYHKRAQIKKRRAARARERAEEERNEKKKLPQQEADNSIPATAWTGIAMILAGAIWLFIGMFSGWIYYAPIAIIAIGLCVAIFGALFGDVDDGDDF